MRLHKVLVAVLGIVLAVQAGADPIDGDESKEKGARQEDAVDMSATERREKGVVTHDVQRRRLIQEIHAPGEVILNKNTAADVTPRVASQVIRRMAHMGDAVKKGQPLVVLSSVQMATAQADLIMADREWRRVQQLGQSVVSQRRYVKARVNRALAVAKVLAYGMTQKEVKNLLRKADPSRADGTFSLLSPLDGTVMTDDFIVGELVQPGRVLYEVANESSVWVDARLAPEEAAAIKVGTPVRVRARTRWLAGQVIHLHHLLNKVTRTLAVRIKVPNQAGTLHAGQFVDVRIQKSTDETPVIAVPSDAVVLLRNAPHVFRIEGDEIHPQPVEIGRRSAGWTQITAGLEPGQHIVTKGVYMVKSLILKSHLGSAQ